MSLEHPYRAQHRPFAPPGGVECLAADMTVVMSADATLATVQQKLGEHRQWLPIDGPADATIGQLVEFNSTGPLKLGYGAWRDLMLGTQFLNGKGELISAGGQTLKNVAGYDLTKFMIGQGQVFGRVITVTARTYRKPAAALLAKFPPDAGTVSKIIATANRPQWAMLTPDALCFGYLGDEPALDFYERSVLGLGPMEFIRRTLAQDVEHRAMLWKSLPMQHQSSPMMFRASVPPVRIKDFVRAAQPGWWVADAAFGIVLGTCNSKDDIPAIRGSAGATGGSTVFRSTSDGSLIGSATDPVQQNILQRLKAAFDSEDTLRPLPQ